MIACVQCEVPASVIIRPGPLTLAVNGTQLVVTDATGSGAGWQVLASASGGTALLEGVTTACSPAEVNGPYQNCPASSVSYPVRVTTSTPVISAGRDTGMGITSYDTQWQVSRETSAPVTITVTIQSGP